MDPDTAVPALFLVLALIAANAFFVAAEFALLTLRPSRIEQSAREGDLRSERLLPILDHAYELSLAAQFGSSAATLLLGYLVAELGLQVLAASVTTQPSLGGSWSWPALAAVAVAILVATIVHVVIGEQIPKLLGVQRAGWIATRVTVGPLRLFALLFFPLTWTLSRVVSGVSRLLRLSAPGLYPLAHTPDEIRILVSRGQEQGVVEEDEREMIDGVFEFSETVAREVMTPRIDIIAVPVETTLDELIHIVVSEGHSRLPVFEGTIDNVIGVLLAKDLLPILWDPKRRPETPFSVRRIMREPYFVPDTKPVDDILAEFRQQSVHLAIVLDEFGGTYGLVTMEDLLEEIVGEINDEYDVAEPEFSPTPEGDVLIDGGASISEVNERFELSLPEADFDTIGGYVFGQLGRVPVPGDAVAGPGEDAEVTLQVEEIEDRRITRVRLTRAEVFPDVISQE
jgi:putative hemolysin